MDSTIAKVVRQKLTDGSMTYDVVIYEDKDYSIIARIACCDSDSAYILESQLNNHYSDGDIVGITAC